MSLLIPHAPLKSTSPSQSNIHLWPMTTRLPSIWSMEQLACSYPWKGTQRLLRLPWSSICWTPSFSLGNRWWISKIIDCVGYSDSRVVYDTYIIYHVLFALSIIWDLINSFWHFHYHLFLCPLYFLSRLVYRGLHKLLAECDVFCCRANWKMDNMIWRCTCNYFCFKLSLSLYHGFLLFSY